MPLLNRATDGRTSQVKAPGPAVAIAHDYLTQRGGAERVLLSMLKAFPEAPVYTSLFNPDTTFSEFASADVRTSYLDKITPFRTHHRLAFPLLASTFSRLSINAEVVLCSSSGWAHGVRAEGRKLVYCFTPARWLYQADRYLRRGEIFARGALGGLAGMLRPWDQRAAGSAQRYVAQSSAVRDRIRALYGIDAEVLAGPCRLRPDGFGEPVEGIPPGYLLAVSRLLPYKNLDRVLAAFAALPSSMLVIVGTGPERARLRRSAPKNVRFLDTVSDHQLVWLYANCSAVVAASYEDYGLTPIEGAAFGKPSAVLRWGGYLDTVIEGETGVFFDTPEPSEIAKAIDAIRLEEFRSEKIRAHAATYSEESFITRLREIVREVRSEN